MTLYTINPPTSEERFEDLCLELLKQHWKRPGLERFGKRGQRQFGVDILDTLAEEPIYAAQCKLKEPTKALDPQEIQDEVDKAKTFPGGLDHYAILTSAKVATASQLKVQQINQEHRQQGLFKVEVIAWNRLSDLVRRYPNIEKEFYGGLRPEEVARVESKLDQIVASTENLTVASGSDAIDSAINEARDKVNPKEAQFARFLLNRILQNKGAQLTPWQRFRIYTNLGAANLNLERANEAAKYFLDAKPLSPDDELACANEVLAYHLLADDPKAHELATDYSVRFPLNPRIRSLWVQSAPINAAYKDLLADVPKALQTDAETAAALARRAMASQEIDSAITHSTDSVAAKPDWFFAQLQRTQILFAQVVFRDRSVNPLTPEERAAALRAANAQAEEAYRIANENDVKWGKSQTRALQADIAFASGQRDDAARFARDAYSLDPAGFAGQCAAAQVAVNREDYTEAIRILEEAYAQMSKEANVSFMLGQALFARSKPEDIVRAAQVFKDAKIAGLDAELADPLIIGASRALVRSDRSTELEEYLTSLGIQASPLLRNTALAYSYLKQGNLTNARERLEQALAGRTPTESTSAIEFLAGSLFEAGMRSAALPLLQELFHIQLPSANADLLLRCAAELGKYQIVIEACETLRDRGIRTWSLAEFESQFLEEYDFPKALTRLKEFTEENADNRVARLRLSIVAMRYGREELIDTNTAAIPAPEDLPMRYATPTIQLLQWSNRADFAVDYAYRLLRANPDDIESHKAFLVSMMPMARPLSIPVTMETVEVGSAVQYAEVGDAPAGWFVIEETTKPNRDFEEIAATSLIAKALLGKKVGDQFVLAPAPAVKDRTGKILQILSKYTRRFQVCGDEMQLKFGEKSIVQTLHVSPSDQLTPDDIQPILNVVKAKEEANRRIRDVYKTTAISLHLFGQAFGHDAFDAVVALAASDTDFIRCAHPQIELINQATSDLRNTTTIVIELSALSTLRLLGLTRQVLGQSGLKFLMTPSTYTALQQERVQMRFRTAHKTIGYEDGQHFVSEATEEQTERQKQAFEEWMQAVEQNTTVIPVPAIAAMDPAKRDSFEQMFGKYGVESAILATNPGHILYTDDLVLAEIAKTEWGVSRTWTQALVASLVGDGQMDQSTADEAYAKLVGLGYQSTHWSGQILVAALRVAGASISAFPAQQLIQEFASVYAVNPIASFQLLAQCVSQLFIEPLLPESKCLVLRTLLDTFPEDANTRAILHNFKKQCLPLFAYNVGAGKAFVQCFTDWENDRFRLKNV